MALREPIKVSRARRRAASIEARPGLDRVQDVLCEPARLRIIAALESDELTVGDLAAAIGRKVPATSQHLRLLRQLDLVEGERRGAAVYYRLRPGPATEQCRAVLEALNRQDPAAS
jgi:ArsR family transcriptional regulator